MKAKEARDRFAAGVLTLAGAVAVQNNPHAPPGVSESDLSQN